MIRQRALAAWCGAVILSGCVVPPQLMAAAAGAADSWPDLASAGKGPGGGEKDAAVIVGAERYAFVAKVPGARQNADEWHAFFTEGLKIPSDRVALLRDNEATLEKMRKFAAQAASEVGPGGTLWFVFIGHGAPSKDGKDGLLVGADAQQDADSLYARSLARRELLAALGRGRQAKTVVLVDACFSGRSPSGAPLIVGLQPLIVTAVKPEAVDPRAILFTAAKSDQFAGPLPKSGKPRPAFSYLLLGGLRGWADSSGDGKVTAGELVEFAQKALKLAKDRTQTPELSAGSRDAVLGLGREAAPDLAKIDREDAAPPKSGGPDFQVTKLAEVPAAQAPAALGAAAGLDLGTVDVDVLEKYDVVVRFDKTEASPEEKAKRWRALAPEAPSYKELAEKRAAEWERFAADKMAAEEAAKARIPARDADWKKLSRLLALSVVPDADKKRWSEQFAAAYLRSPGIEPVPAGQLAQRLSSGETKTALEELARRPAAASAPAPAAAGDCLEFDGVTMGQTEDDAVRAWGAAGTPYRAADRTVFSWTRGEGGVQAHLSKKSGRIMYLMLYHTGQKSDAPPVQISGGGTLGTTEDEFLRLHPGLRSAKPSEVGERINYSHGPHECLGSYQFSKSDRRLVGLVLMTLKPE